MKHFHSRIIKRLLYKANLKTKLFVIPFILIALPLLITGITMFKNISDMIIGSLYNLTDTSLQYAGQVMDSKLSMALDIADIVITNSDVQAILSKNKENYSLEEQLIDMKALIKYLRSLEKNSGIVRIRLVVRDGLIYSNEGLHFINYARLSDYSWGTFKDELDGYPFLWKANSIKWYDNIAQARDVVSCVKAIRNVNNYDDILGLVFIDIPLDELSKVLAQSDPTKSGFVFAIDKNGVPLVKSGIIKNIDVNRAISLASDAISNRKRDIEIDGVTYQVHVEHLNKSGWDIMSFIPLDSIERERNKLTGFILALMITLASITIIVGDFFYTSILKRIQCIVTGMEKVKNGDLDAAIEVKGEDEIGLIENNYNYMINRIKRLLEETYALGKKAREAELKALQNQINPHFLYNVLNTISWTALDYGAEKVCRMIKALSDFYKLNLQMEKQEVTLKDEIRHVQLYIEIQNMCYRDAITLEINILDEIQNCLIPNLILQPLVENSIIHGILAKDNKQGRIIISGVTVENDVIISIVDDGVGMDEKSLDRVISNPSSSENYGIYNINERIRLKYGEEYGLHFESRPNHGTRVDIKIPMVVSI